jgi:hypothetical protein
VGHRSKQLQQKQRREEARGHFDAVMAAYGGLCHWCGEPVVRFNTLSRHWNPRVVDGWICYRRRGKDHRVRLATVDHIRPLWRGGSSALKNLVLACGECNQIRNEIDWIREHEWFDFPQRRAFANYCYSIQHRLTQKLKPGEFTAEARALYEACSAMILGAA